MPQGKAKKQAVVTPAQKKETGLPLGINKATAISPEKVKAIQEYADGVREIAGIAGDAALRSFANGMGVDFKIEGDEFISDMRKKGDTGLYIDGKPAVKSKEELEMIRGYLKEFYKMNNNKQK